MRSKWINLTLLPFLVPLSPLSANAHDLLTASRANGYIFVGSAEMLCSLRGAEVFTDDQTRHFLNKVFRRYGKETDRAYVVTSLFIFSTQLNKPHNKTQVKKGVCVDWVHEKAREHNIELKH